MKIIEEITKGVLIGAGFVWGMNFAHFINGFIKGLLGL